MASGGLFDVAQWPALPATGDSRAGATQLLAALFTCGWVALSRHRIVHRLAASERAAFAALLYFLSGFVRALFLCLYRQVQRLRSNHLLAERGGAAHSAADVPAFRDGLSE